MESSPSSSFTSSSIQIGVLYIFISAFQLVASNCPSPSVPFANAHNGSTDTVYPPGTTLTYTCLTGFTSDDKYRICQMDGYWTGNDKVCKLNFISFFVALMSAVGVIMIFIMLVSCLFFGRRKRTNPHRTVIREDSSSTVAMKDSRTPTPLGSFYNNNRASFQNGGSRKNGSVQNDSLPEYVHSDSLPESYITDDDNLSSLPSPRDKLNHHDHMELNNISIYTPPPPSPPPSATIPENDLSFIPPPPTPIKPENIASLLNSEPTTIPEFIPPPPTPNKPENITSLLNSEPTTSEDEGRISNPGIEISDLSFNPPPPPPSKPKNIASLLNSEPTTSEDEGGLSNPGVDDVDGERSEFEKLGFTRNPYTSATFIRQGEGWVHDDASFDSYDEEETEEQRQYRAAIDVAL